jgi:hypothetical protein
VINRPGRQKPSYISALNHNEFVAVKGETECVGCEIIQPHLCTGLVAGMFRNRMKLFIQRNNRNSEKLGDDDRIGDLAFIIFFVMCQVI